MSVNKVILVGRLGQNPELRYTPTGAAVANFSVATSESWMDKSGQKQEKTEWHRIVVWGKTAEICNQYLTKGRQIYLEGRLQTRQWQDKDGQTKYTTEVQAQTVQFLGNSQGAGAGAGDRPREFGNASGGMSSGGFSSGFGSQENGGSGSSQLGGASSGGGGYSPMGEPSSSSLGTSFTEDDIPF